MYMYKPKRDATLIEMKWYDRNNSFLKFFAEGNGSALEQIRKHYFAYDKINKAQKIMSVCL